MNLRSRQLGQAMFEFNLALPLLIPFVLLSMMLAVQWVFIYVGKSTLDAATIKAVRAGALNHGNKGEMEKALAEGLIPLYVRDTDLLSSYSALAEARIAVATLSDLKVLNPTKAVFDQFKYRAKVNNNSVNEIPNDNLMYRSTVQKDVGDGRKINIQDANLLQIEVRWCHRLVVPFANYAIKQIVTSVLYQPSKEQLTCNALGLATDDVYLAMISQGMMRMQTPFRM
ncbi:pilus assembly protein [Shewanella sp. 3B26]|uniref:Pilus assembly protein n=1 Tax=Shewanella zhuhaiensis TaxID=2919576 RepID=A0AAJ1BE38_9GAMM|nr:pilus assembly protein [Shewanella zhuhaiensis]MCH4293096.1 pilus assembly protein [Shewanella zhuhaiensis]